MRSDDSCVEFFHLTCVFLAGQRWQLEALDGETMPVWRVPIEKSD